MYIDISKPVVADAVCQIQGWSILFGYVCFSQIFCGQIWKFQGKTIEEEGTV